MQVQPPAAPLDALRTTPMPMIELVVPGGCVAVDYDVDVREAERRSAAGLGAIERRPLLEALAALPLGASVRWADIDLSTQVELDTAPEGCVVSDGESVGRVVGPAVELHCFVAEFEGRQSIEDISLFAAMAPRMLVGRRRPSAATVAELLELGIGFVVAADHDLELLVAPKVQLVRPGPRRWFVQERIWRLHQASAEIHALR